jgi:hypothetical protein
MVPAVRPLGSLSMARGCAWIDSRPDTAKIGSADRVEVHHARLLAVIGVRKTFPHGLDPERTLGAPWVLFAKPFISIKFHGNPSANGGRGKL